MPNTEPEFVHVAVGIVRNQAGEVLIAFRDHKKHQGGLWEFPGGKVETGEGIEHALARELKEELNLQVLDSSPLLKIEHDYGDKKVLLDVRQVDSFLGEASGMEGQAIKWVKTKELVDYDFPVANLEIVSFLADVGQPITK